MAKESPLLAAAIQVSDRAVTELGVRGLGKFPTPPRGSYKELSGWTMLTNDREDIELLEDKLDSSIDRLSQTLNGIF